MARLNQKQAAALAFVGTIAATLTAVDFSKLKFEASIRLTDGAGATTSFEPCTDDGLLKVFSNIDDVLTWLRGAYFDMSAVSFTVPMVGITKEFTPPTDSLKDAIAKRASFVKLGTGIADNLAKATSKVASDVASGWNAPTAHPALQATYNESVAKLAAVQAIKDFYTAETARYNTIVVAGGGLPL